MSEKVNILLVEDNPGDARLVQIYLQESTTLEFDLTHVVRLSDAIALSAKGEHYDVILLDLSLPDSKGFQTLLTATAEFPPSSSIVVLTGLNDESLGIKAVEAGAQDYLVKGQIDTTLLTRSILHAIFRRKMQLEVETTAKNLKISEERLLLAQRIAHIGNYEYRLPEKSLYASEEIYSILETNFNQTAFSHEQFYALINTPPHQPSVKELYDQIIQSKKAGFDLEHRLFIKTEAHYKYIRNQGQIEYDAETGSLVRVTGTIQDITAYKHAEEMLKQSQERYKIVFEESQDAVYITTLNGEFVEFNQTLLNLLGNTRNELLSTNFSALFAQPAQLAAFETKLFSDNGIKDFEVKFKRADGKVMDCAITSTVWKTLEGEIIGYHGIIRDITILKRTQELIKAKEIAEQSAHLKEQFLANMSHEIRTPMNVVVGMAHLMEATDLNHKQWEYVNALKLSADNLLRLINNILDFSKMEAGKVVLEKRPFNLHNLVNDLVATYKFKAQENNIHLFADIHPDLPQIVIGDSMRLYQILNNLLSNAIKYTHQGEIVLAAKLLNQGESTQELGFSVKDTGIGIPKNKQQAIFDSFTQAADDTTRLYGGTGLGLTIAKNLVELFGGNLSVQSEQGKGTVFSFNVFFENNADALTLAEQNESLQFDNQVIFAQQEFRSVRLFADENRQPNETHSGKKPSLNRQVNILLVEDQRLNQIVASELLSKWSDNIVIEIAGNGKEAVEMVEKKGNHYHIILMDLSMPVMDGYEATKLIRETLPKPSCNIPIVAMTAHAYNTNAQKCFEVGMNEFITKPIQPDILYSKLSILLGLQETIETAATETQETEIVPENMEKASPINLDYLKSLSGDDHEVLIIMLETLTEDLPNEVELLVKANDGKDWKALKSIAHKFKSTCAYMGMDSMVELARNIENSLWEGNVPDMLDNWVAILSHNCLEAHTELLSVLKNLKAQHHFVE